MKFPVGMAETVARQAAKTVMTEKRIVNECKLKVGGCWKSLKNE